MALLNPPNILPDLAFAVYRTLAAHGGTLDWDSMYAQLVPNPDLFKSSETDPTTASEPNDPLNQTIRSLVEIGFFSAEKGVISLGEEVPVPSNRSEDRKRFVRSLTSSVMVDAVNRQQRWGKDAPGSLDLTRSLSFALMQDPHRPCFFSGSGRIHDAIREVAVNLETERIEHIGSGDDDAQVLHNDERWQSFVRWAIVLGFAERVPPSNPASSSQQVLIRMDPTRAIGIAIETMPPDRYPVLEFLRALGARLPVLPPFGPLHGDLVGQWIGDFPTGETEVPPTVAMALRVLDEQGRLTLGRGADAPEVARLILEYAQQDKAQVAEQVARVEVS